MKRKTFRDFVSRIDYIDIAEIYDYGIFDDCIGNLGINSSSEWDYQLKKEYYRISFKENNLAEQSDHFMDTFFGVLSNHAHEIRISLVKNLS